MKMVEVKTTSFQRRSITITVKFEDGETVVLQGYRVLADIEMAGGQTLGTAKLKIYGLSEALMAKLTTYVWQQLKISKTTVTTEADGTVVHKGNIVSSFADYSSMPDVCMYMEVNTTAYYQVAPALVKSYRDTAKVTDIIASIAKEMGLIFEKGNVDEVLYKPYFTGTSIDQLRAVCTSANIDFFILNDVLALSKKNKAIEGIAHVVSPESGLVGYPTMQPQAINFTMLFNPSLRYWGWVEVKSAVIGANGLWRVQNLSHRLDSEMPNGRWFSDVQALSSRLFAGKT